VSAALGRLAERLPLADQLAMLLVATAERPVAAPTGPSNGHVR
jgi:hypothetical protein